MYTTEILDGLGNTLNKLEEQPNKPAKKNIKNEENAYSNLIGYLLKLLENQLLVDENVELEKEKHKPILNSMTEKNTPILFKSKSKHSISNVKNDNTISTSDIQNLNNIQSCTSLHKNIMSDSMIETLVVKQEKESIYSKSLQNNNPEDTFQSDLQKKNMVKNQSEFVETLFIKTSPSTNNLNTKISKSNMFNSIKDKPNDVVEDIFDAGELVKSSISSIRKECRPDCIFDDTFFNADQMHEKINNNDTNKDTEIKINHDSNCGNISLPNNYEFESGLHNSSYEILFSDRNRIENEMMQHDLVVDNVQEIIKRTNDESISQINNVCQEMIKHLLRFDNRCKEMTQSNLFIDTNYNEENFGTIKTEMKMDKSSQTIMNSPEGGLDYFTEECLIKNSINVATQAVSNTVDISSQTSSTVFEFKPTESMHSKLNYTEEQRLKEDSIEFLKNENDQVVKSTFDEKWPVNAHYIHGCNRYEIKQKVSISSNRKSVNKNSNYTKEIESYSPSKAKIVHSSETNICKPNVFVDLTKESRLLNLLNLNFDKKMIPDYINSYQLGLSDIDSAVLIQHIQNDYNMFPNDLTNLIQNTVSLHYLKTKNSNDKSMNWESVISVFTSSDNVNKVTSNMLKQRPSTNSIDSNFVKTQTKSSENYFRLFDINGYPLTNAFGNVLKNPYGHNVVDLCSIDTTSSNVVYDAVLNPSTSCDFNPYLKPTSKNIGIKLTADDTNPLLLFDKYGRPLTDSTGMILVNNHGRTLLRFNNIGQPISDHRGGELYTENGILWSLSDENNETIFNNEVEMSVEGEFIKESDTNIVTNSFCQVLDKFSKSQIVTTKGSDVMAKVSDISDMGKISVEFIKAKIQEPLPIIDDFDLTSSKLNIKMELKNINLGQEIKANKHFKLLSTSQVLNATKKGNSSLFQFKNFQSLHDLQNSKLNSFNIKTKNSKPSLDEPSTSTVVDSILSMDWGIKNKVNNFKINQNKLSDHLSRIHCSKTSKYKCLSTCSSSQRIHNKANITAYNYNSVFKPTGIERDIKAKTKFNIGDKKYFSKNIHYSNKNEFKVNEMNDYVEGYYTSKYLPSNFSFLPNDEKRMVFTDSILHEHQHHMKNDLKSKLDTQTEKLLDNKHVIECRYNLKSNKISKDDIKTTGPKLKTKRKTEVKHRIKDTQHIFSSSKKCKKSKTINQIHVGNDTSTTFNSCFHAPVQFLLHKLDKTLLCNQKEVVMKNNKHNLRKSRFSQKQKNHDKVRTKNKGEQENKMSVNEMIGSYYKKPQLDEKSKLKQNKTDENMCIHKQKGDFLSGFDYDKYKLTTPNSKTENPLYDGYNHLLNSTLFSYDEPSKLQSKYYQPNGPTWSYKNSRNSLNNESNVAYLINKYTKSSIPSKVLPSTNYTPCPSVNSNFNSPPKKQFSSIEKNNYFYDSLKTLNRRFVDLKYCESNTNEVNPSCMDKKKTFIIPHDKPGNNFFLNLQSSTTNPHLF